MPARSRSRVPLRLSDGPAGAVVAFATDGSPLDEAVVATLESLGDQLSAQLQLSELHTATTTALQAQMEPHFVFNALNTIASFIRTDPERARTLVVAFADHLRRRLARPGEFVTLEDELHHVRSYLKLEQARFGSQLEVTIDAAPDALAVRLPPLLVQPLVENAIKHGKTDRPLHLLVRARVRRGQLRVTVRDDGRGIARDAIERVLEPGVGEGTGIGLANVNLRLTAHYGAGRASALVPVRHGRAAGGPAARPDRRRRGACARRAALSARGARRRRGRRRGGRAPTRRSTSRTSCGPTSCSSTSRCPARAGSALRPLLNGAVVFVTAHERYAVDAFAVEAFDYLLKPVDADRLARVVERLRERSSENAAPVERIPVVAGGGTELLLDPDQIHYVTADGDYSRVHTYDRSYLCTSSLGELEERLGSRFARVHRSHLVNLAKVAGVKRTAPDRLRLQVADAARTELDVARRQSRLLRDRLKL